MHPDEERLLQHTLGQLSAAAAADVDAHLGQCEACRVRQQAISSIVFAKTSPGLATPTDAPKNPVPTQPDSPLATQGVGRTPLERGTLVGRYVVIGRIGAGGMGEVLNAYDPQLDRRVALKLLRAGSLSAAEGKARLLREAQAMARLQHPNVIAVHDVGTYFDRVFIAMEFVAGETLAEWMKRPHDWHEVVSMFVKAGAGLAAAHAAGLVHRDFKPDNVLIGEDGRPRVVDFGLARQATATPATGSPTTELEPTAETNLMTPLTRDGAVMGTPGYMAPEQISGLVTDARCDQFSFSVALWEALSGQRPFGGSTLRQHAVEIARQVFPPPPSGSKVPTRVFEVLKRGLAADPGQRYPDMRALLDALRPVPRTQRRLIGLGVALALLSGLGLSVFWQHRERTRLCGGAEARLVDVWDAATRARTQRAFLETKLPYAASSFLNVEGALDTYALQWVATSRDACDAFRIRKVDSPQLNGLKSSCLEERLEALRALTHLLSASDKDVVAHASAAVRTLDPVSGCTDEGALSHRKSVDPKDAEAEAGLRKSIAEGRALFDAGKYVAGVALLKGVLTASSPPGPAAEGFLLLGRLQLRSADAKGARASHLLAAEDALKAADPKLMAFAFSRLSSSDGLDPAESSEWGRLAHAAAAHLDDWEVEAELATNDAFVELRSQHLPAALALYEQVLQLQEAHLGAQHPEIAMTLNNLGVTLSNLGEFDRAIEKYERSVKLHATLEGDDHPNTALAEHNLGFALRRQGRYTEATRSYEHAFLVRSKVLGPESPETLKTSDALARVLTATGQHDRALELLQASHSIRVRLFGDSSTEVAQNDELLTDLYIAGRFWKEARTWAQQTLEIARSAGAPTGDQASNAMFRLGLIDLHLGAWADARRELDEALAMRVALHTDKSNEVAAVHNALGDLALAQKRPDEARDCFQRALKVRSSTTSPESKAGDLLGLGRSLLALDKAAEAIEPLTEAVALLEKVENRFERAGAQLELGRALWLTQTDRERAQELFRASVPELPEDIRREALVWLRRNDAGVVQP